MFPPPLPSWLELLLSKHPGTASIVSLLLHHSVNWIQTSGGAKVDLKKTITIIDIKLYTNDTRQIPVSPDHSIFPHLLLEKPFPVRVTLCTLCSVRNSLRQRLR